jgi:adenylate kinase family enzyme
MRVVIYGNSGSGKTTMARRLAREAGVAHLDLDAIAWGAAGVRLPLEESVRALIRFVETHPGWVIEGSYGGLVREALTRCDDLRFLNPGVEACVTNCQRRGWEPEKYPSAEEQDRMLAFLIDWVRLYPSRTDEYGLAAHREIFDSFDGRKKEFGLEDLRHLEDAPV